MFIYSYDFQYISKFGNNLGDMNFLLFCIIIVYEFLCKIDTNHNGIYLGTVSLQWSCDMMLTFCMNGHKFESHLGQI